METHIECKQENLIREMHGDLKTLLTQSNMVKEKIDSYSQSMSDHVKDSCIYRRKVDFIWAGMHVIKWVIGLLLGAGLIWKAIEVIVNDKTNQVIVGTINSSK